MGNLALSTYDEIFRAGAPEETGDKVIMISLEELHEPKGHPFNVFDDDDMLELAESVGKFGVMVPGVARPRKEGGYETVAGNRRRRASELAGVPEMPMIVRELDDDEAAILMVDSNLQRETILPSEKARAYKIKLEATKRQAESRIKSNAASARKKSSELLAEQSGESKNQIYRYIRLTELLPGLLDLVDGKKLTLVAAVELSYLTEQQQTLLSDLLNKGISAPTLSQAQKLREAGKHGEYFGETAERILIGSKAAQKPFSLGAGKIKKYFPPDYSAEQMESVVLSLLEQWQMKNN
jgi:ParB family chromosome partitioning protein